MLKSLIPGPEKGKPFIFNATVPGVRQNSSWFKRTAVVLRSARSGELVFAAVKKLGNDRRD
jgi:hypothetical protein